MKRTMIALFLLGWALWAVAEDGTPTHILRYFKDGGDCLTASYRTSFFTGQTTVCRIDLSV